MNSKVHENVAVDVTSAEVIQVLPEVIASFDMGSDPKRILKKSRYQNQRNMEVSKSAQTRKTLEHYGESGGFDGL